MKETDLTDQERELLQAAAKEFQEASEVEGFSFEMTTLNRAAPIEQTWGGPDRFPPSYGGALQAATDYASGGKWPDWPPFRLP